MHDSRSIMNILLKKFEIHKFESESWHVMDDCMHRNNGQDAQKGFLHRRYIEISSWLNKN